MKYFIKTEFLEGTQKNRFPVSLFCKETKPTIDLISIGIVNEAGNRYYAISKDFNLKEAWNRYDCNVNIETKKEGAKTYWIRDNVLKPIYGDLFLKDVNKTGKSKSYKFNYKTLKQLINKYGKSNKQIAEGVKDFCYNGCEWNYPNKPNEIKIYGYFADYDWVALCWLFGKMINLPKGFPMYCKDLKQMADNVKLPLAYTKSGLMNSASPSSLPMCSRMDEVEVFEYKTLDAHPAYPKQPYEHNALSDALWNKELFYFLRTLNENT